MIQTTQRLSQKLQLQTGQLFFPASKSVPKKQAVFNGIEKTTVLTICKSISSWVIIATTSKTKDITDHEHRKPRSGRRSVDNCKASQVVTLRNPCNEKELTPLRIATWNVTSMYKIGKIQNVIQEMNRLKLDILRISEVKATQSGQFQTTNLLKWSQHKFEIF